MNTTAAANKPSSLIPAGAIVRHWTTPRCQSRTPPGRQSALNLAQQTNNQKTTNKKHKKAHTHINNNGPSGFVCWLALNVTMDFTAS